MSKKINKIFQKKIITLQCNISSKYSVKKIFTYFEKNKIKLDSLINNADIDTKYNQVNKNLIIENLNYKFWDKHINVGLKGTMNISSQYYNYLLKNKLKGNIVNIASDLAIIAPNQELYKLTNKKKSVQPVKPISYSVVKHAIIGLTKYFSTYDPEILRCNALAPGGVKVNNKNFEKKFQS